MYNFCKHRNNVAVISDKKNNWVIWEKIKFFKMRLFRTFNKYKNNIAIIDKEYSDLSYKQVLTETNKIKKKIFHNRFFKK